MTKEESLMGGPGLDGYAYQADVYCVDCGHRIIESIDVDGLPEYLCQSTEDLPQPIFFGESDGPQYCADCGEYLYGTKNAADLNIEIFYHEHMKRELCALNAGHMAERGGECILDSDGDCTGTGWYYWYCFPGALPDSDPYGPFDTEKEAFQDCSRSGRHRNRLRY